MITHLDHIYSYLKDNNLDDALARFERAGFLPMPDKVRHSLGMLNRFISLTGSYLEFVSIVDDADFQKNAGRRQQDSQEVSSSIRCWSGFAKILI